MPLPVKPIFLSVFYPVEKWKELMTEMQRLCAQPEFSFLASDMYVATGSHRGDHLRIVMPNQMRTRVRCHRFISRLREFVNTHPGEEPAQEKWLSSFFMDFPVNAFRFNLFNERSFDKIQYQPLADLISQTEILKL